MRSATTRLNTGILAIASLILIAIVGLSYREWKHYSSARGEAIQTRAAQDSADRLLLDLIDAETGERGFVLTGEVRYLEPYSRAVPLVPPELAKLNSLLVQTADQRGGVAQLSSAVNQELAELLQTIDIRRARGLAPALDLSLSDRGIQTMDQIRGMVAEIKSRAELGRADASLEAQSAAQRSLLITAAGSLILLGFLIVGNTRINKAIQARERALAEAQIARDYLKTTIASIGDAVITTDAQGHIVFANKVAQSLLRASEADIVGKHLDDVFRIVNEFTRATVESPVAKVLREGRIVGMANHTVLIAQDGTEIPIDDSGAPIRAGREAIEGTVLVFRDVTARRNAELTSHLLASIVESSADGIVSKDLNGIVTSWNNGAEQITGYSAEEMIGHLISAIIPPGLVDETKVMVDRVKKGEKIQQYETVRRTKSGKLINVSISWSPIFDAAGRIVGASKVFRDITERKQAEERFHLAVEASPNGMVVSNEDGEIILVNSHTEKLFGYHRDELIGQRIEILAPQHLGDDHPQYRKTFHAAPSARAMGEGRDLFGRRKDGSEFPVEIGLNPIEASAGRWVLSVIVDITERKRIQQERIDLVARERALAAEKALQAARQELARVSRALTVGELATSIAHEVNQPLAGVVTNAEACLRWLSGKTPNVPEAQESIALIVRDGNRASQVIRRIREFLKKENPEAEPVNINNAIQDAVALVHADLLKARVELRLELTSGLPTVLGDRVQLQQVILNLLINARDSLALVDDGQPRELAVTSQKAGANGIIVAVRDGGVGIYPQHLEQMFDAFFTTKPEGMGLGLSLSRSIIEAHGGRIWAAANDGPGLKVQFSLPLAKNEITQ